ncbi:MAG: NTP transferase domain-containing protein [Armatimonadia bacterium]|nr:NTP transferase domain-containing protein [Armatimonadia bacterium]
MKVVILCGGRGLRLTGREPTLPKPMVEIGGRPILWHVMMGYAHYGFREFVLCLGHLGEAIKEYFVAREAWRDADVRLRIGQGETRRLELQNSHHAENFDIIFADTGNETPSGERLLRVADYLDDEDFFCTYCDGLWNSDPRRELEFHRSHGKLATATAVRAPSSFGMLDLASDDEIKEFREKPLVDQWINGGFFVMSRAVLDEIRPGDALESDVLTRLADEGQLMGFRHTGFWQCMDTYKEQEELDALWRRGEAPWNVWGGGR